VKFWDASAIVPLLVDEPSSSQLKAVAVRDPGMCVWWGSQIECISALARLERSGILAAPGLATALERLTQMTRTWQEIAPSDAVRDLAARLLRVHPLRAADALQLAAAQAAADSKPESLELVTLDDRLALAARKEGFVVIDAEALS
jgi:predicted nucleic acid-binding protein